MTPAQRYISLPCLLLLASAAFGQNPAAPKVDTSDKASAYYNYSLGHMYAELATANGNKGDYFNRAVESYQAALKADPSATFISEELSDLYIQSGRLREAVTQAEDQLKQDPNNLNARRLLARIYTRLIGDSQANRIDENMVKRAVEQYEKITETDPKDIESWLMLGRLQKVLQNSTDAMKAYKKVLELDPDNEEGQTGLATVYADLGDNRAAAELLRKVADKNPNPRSLMSLAGVYEQLRDYPLAAEMLRRALDQQPGNSDLKRALAEDLMMSDQLDEALKLYQQMAADEPKDPSFQMSIAEIYIAEHDLAKARAAMDKAKTLDPHSRDVRFADSKLLEAEGKNDQALAILKSLLNETQRRQYAEGDAQRRSMLLEQYAVLARMMEQYQVAVDAFREMADLHVVAPPRVAVQVIDTYRQAKDFTNAMKEADLALKTFPDDHMIQVEHATVLADQGKVDAAVAELNKIPAEGHEKESQLVTLARFYEQAKRFPEMGKALDDAEKLASNDDEKTEIYFMRGAMYERMKKFDSSEAEFRKVLAIDPNHAETLNYLGYMLADRNVRLEEARDLIVKALEKEPNTGAYLDSLGWVNYRLNRLPEAEENLRQALMSMSRDPTVHDHLAEVYFREGKIREAIQQWQSSLKEWQTSPPSELDHAEISKVQKKLDDAKVRLAKEGTSKPAQ